MKFGSVKKSMKNQTLIDTLKNNATYGGENLHLDKLSEKVKKLL